MTSAGPTVRFARDGALGTVTLASPPLNLIGRQLISDLLAAISEVEAADAAACVLGVEEADRSIGQQRVGGWDTAGGIAAGQLFDYRECARW
ncbi:MAG TPA: hypothetical protein VMS16_13110, partial [Mycobacterium sp.]|nr:hypothetical protein [Mycobacterium sp.]